MSAGYEGTHTEIVATEPKALWTADGYLKILVEYRADGCTTWRQA